MSKNLARQTNAVILLASIYSGNPQYRFDLILNSSRPITGSEKTKSAKKNVDCVFQALVGIMQTFCCNLQKLLTD